MSSAKSSLEWLKPPRGEIAWVTYCKPSGEAAFLLTSKPQRDWYFLYEKQQDGSLKKVCKGKTPPEVEEKYHIEEKLRA